MELDLMALFKCPKENSDSSCLEVTKTEKFDQLTKICGHEQQERKRILEVHRMYQQNIIRAGLLRSDILRGLQRGDDIYFLFLKAVECIALMTGEQAMYNQAKQDIKSVYGFELFETYPLKLELCETKNRIVRMTEALETDLEQCDRERIERAVKVHRERVDCIRKKLNNKNEL